jgi:hypothetical protein
VRRQLVAALALTGLLALAGASTAAAQTTPEWFECLKEKGVGTLEKGCAGEGGKGGYVAQPGTGTGTLTISGKGHVVLRGVPTLECAHFKITGQKQMPNLLTGVTLTFTLCHRAVNAKYHCEGQEEGGPKEKGVIESEPLAGEVGYISRTPVQLGLKLSNAAEPGGLILPRIYCIGPPAHYTLSGSFVGEIGGVVNEAGKRGRLHYVPGPYLGESSPLVDPPLEGEEAGGLTWGGAETGPHAAIEGEAKLVGEQMITG